MQQRCERPRLIEATIGGDLRGRAAVRLATARDGTRADVAYPLMCWGHDCVVEMAVAGFRRRALPGMTQTPAVG